MTANNVPSEPTITIGPIVYASDDIEHGVDMASWLEPLRSYLVKWWGNRCPDFNEGCESCKRWNAFDVLKEHPFEEPK